MEALVGSALFTGYFPIAPATVTSFFVLVPAYFLRPYPVWHALAIVVLFFVVVLLALVLFLLFVVFLVVGARHRILARQ